MKIQSMRNSSSRCFSCSKRFCRLAVDIVKLHNCPREWYRNASGKELEALPISGRSVPQEPSVRTTRSFNQSVEG